MDQRELWERYKQYLCTAPSIGLQLDVSRMDFDDEFLKRMSGPMAAALTAVEELERGAKANIDEDRMVGHYWLRAPQLAPDETIRSDIEQAVANVRHFANEIHSGAIKPQRGDSFDVVLVIGIGGSALGPQFVADALGNPDDLMLVRFIDNTDPDGIDRTLVELDEALAQTLTIVISKSGTTIETRNAMIEVAARYKQVGLDFAKHAVAITCEGSVLHQQAAKEAWVRTFPTWEWVGGRTSVTSAVGLLPAALQGIDIDDFLAGARAADVVTRGKDTMANPATLLALMWHYAGNGRGERNMVVMPYRDRLAFFTRYLQQIVMESVGKERDRVGNVVHQGLTVYGNKGTSDQHSFLQQLCDGPNDFFVTFIDVRKDYTVQPMQVEKDVTTGDYLHAFMLGTTRALSEKGRESITFTLDELTPHRVGALMALLERSIGLYTELINVNAYNQPGVEVGKRAVGVVIELQRKILGHLGRHQGATLTAEELGAELGDPEAVGNIHDILERLSTDPRRGVIRAPGCGVAEARYAIVDHPSDLRPQDA